MDNVGAGLPRDSGSTANIASRGKPAPTVPSSLRDSAARKGWVISHKDQRQASILGLCAVFVGAGASLR